MCQQQRYLVDSGIYKNLVGECFLIQDLEYGFWNCHSHSTHLWYTGNGEWYPTRLASIQSLCEIWGSYSSDNGWGYPDD